MAAARSASAIARGGSRLLWYLSVDDRARFPNSVDLELWLWLWLWLVGVAGHGVPKRWWWWPLLYLEGARQAVNLRMEREHLGTAKVTCGLVIIEAVEIPRPCERGERQGLK